MKLINEMQKNVKGFKKITIQSQRNFRNKMEELDSNAKIIKEY